MNESGHCSANEAFALRVIGDDMAPEFVDGQIVIVEPAGKISSGCFVVARLDDGVILRQLVIDGDAYRLRALQPGPPEIELRGGVEALVGVVSQRAGRRRREHKRYEV